MFVDPSSKAHHTTTSILPSVVSAQMYNAAAQLASSAWQSALRARSVGKGFATVEENIVMCYTVRWKLNNEYDENM